MINNLLKAGLWIKVYLWLKPRYKKLFIAFAIIFITWLIHSEYLSYVDRSGAGAYLWQSYIIKWLLILTAVFWCFLPFSVNRNERGAVDTARSPSTNTANTDIKFDDGFDFLRNKKKLETKADKVINKG